uniref:Mediator of RNA polymerase II transcription subunit 31 n=1 Tax=Myotis myotis TaxID=51298 RepID=A0A7J7T6D6_MYOMY|nr:mediator complex subunit 31 [Myotis myotis]
MAAAVAMETDDAGNRLRFQLELEFVQCLANPNYLNLSAFIHSQLNGIIAALILVYILYIIEQAGTCFMNSVCVGGGDVMCVNSLLEVTNQWFKDWFALQMHFFFFMPFSSCPKRLLQRQSFC